MSSCLKGDVPGNLVPNLQPMWRRVKDHVTFVDQSSVAVFQVMYLTFLPRPQFRCGVIAW